MQVQKIQSTQNNNSYYKYNLNHQPTFKSVSVAVGLEAARKGLVWLGISAKTYQSFDNHRIIYKAKDSVQNVLRDLDITPSARAVVLTAISKMKNGTDETGLYTFYEIFRANSHPRIKDLKDLALTKIITEMDDNNNTDRTAKQELFLSMFDNGEYLNENYIKAFQALPDTHYAKLKEIIADKCLYGIKRYDKNITPEHFIYSLKIIKSLDKINHAEYLKKSTEAQLQLLNTAVSLAYKKLTAEHNLAYKYYCYNGKSENNYLYMNNMDLWRPYTEKAFYKTLLISDGNPEKLAELLNIDTDLANDIIEDYKILDVAEETDDNTIKYELYKMRINEKFEHVLPNENNEKDLPVKYFALHMKLHNILNFMKKTDMTETLLTTNKTKLNTLMIKYQNCYNNYNSASIEDEIPMWAHYDC